MARDHITAIEKVNVIAGIMSPVHELYKEKNVTANVHRRNMINLALSTSNWIRLSELEFQQPHWISNDKVVQYHQVCKILLKFY